MRTNLRKIGNSQGLIIPAALLDICNLTNEVDIRVEGKSLIIEALHPPRQGWFDNYTDQVAEAADWDVLTMDDEANEEWQW